MCNWCRGQSVNLFLKLSVLGGWTLYFRTNEDATVFSQGKTLTRLLRGITAKMNAVNVELQRAPKWWWSAVSRVSQRSPFKATSFCPHIPHLTTSVSPRSISYSLAHSNIAPLLHAKLTPQVLLYLLTDTCSLKMILSPAANIAAHSGGVLDSIIKLKKRQSEGGWRERRKKKEELDWLEKNNRGLRKLSRQGRVSLLSDSRSESSSSWNLCSWDRPSRAWQSSRMMSNIISDQIHCYAITIQTPYFNCGEKSNKWHQLN